MSINGAFFASSKLHERELSLTLDDGSVVKETLYIREVTPAEIDTIKRCGDFLAGLLSACVCDANGDPHFTSDEAGKLKGVVFSKLSDVVLEVNGWGKVSAGKAAPP